MSEDIVLDIVLQYLERLRGVTDSPRLLGHIDEVEADRASKVDGCHRCELDP